MKIWSFSSEFSLLSLLRLKVTLLLWLVFSLSSQAQDELYIYQHSGVTDTLQLSDVADIRHLRTDLSGKVHEDFILMCVAMNDETEHRYLLANLDSVVMVRDGSRIPLTRFIGGMTSRKSNKRHSLGKRRTSFDGDFMSTVGSTDGVDFFWTADDHIYLDGGQRDTEVHFVDENTKATAEFYFEGVSLTETSIPVWYLGETSPNPIDKHVRISKDQTQLESNNTLHIGRFGDCGVAVATKSDGESFYRFNLDHKASYLCFLPYMSNDLNRTVLKKITVRSDKEIAGVFTLAQDGGLTLVSNPSHTITLKTGDESGFVIPQKANQRTSAYMVIAPQSESTRLTCEFTVYDTLLESEGIYTKQIDLDEVEPNMVYVIKANCNNYVVDMGLPVKFLNHNMGAFSPEDFGGYYAFGELNDKGYYTLDNYSLKNANLSDIAEIRFTDKDVAHMRLGQNFSIPSNIEMRMLVDSLGADKWVWKAVNGHSGYLVTGKNGNHLFFPAAGYRTNGTSINNSSTNGFYRTSTMLSHGFNRSWRFTISNGTHVVSEASDEKLLYQGLSIRPVVSTGVQTTEGTIVQVMTDSVRWHIGESTATLYGTQYGFEKTLPSAQSSAKFGFIIGSEAEVKAFGGTKIVGMLEGTRVIRADFTNVEDFTAYYYRTYAEIDDSICYGNILNFGRTCVDLGLPSGTKWSNVNVDANTDSESGGYYAWGETVEKSSYSNSTFKWYQQGTYIFPDGLRDVQATRHDVASVKWEGPWMSPSYADIQELYNNCTITNKYNYNGVRGYLFTSKIDGYKDRSIFIPETGYMGTSLTNFFSDDYVPSSTYRTEQNNTACQIYNGSVDVSWAPYNGKSFRPVYKTNTTSKTGKPMYIRTLPASKKFDGIEEADTLKAAVRTLPADGTKIGFVWWQKGHEDDKHFVEVTPDADNYISTVLTGLTAGSTYYYNVYVDNGNAEYDYADEMSFDAVGLVDLGLSVKWANVNMGAANEASSGDFYRWGTTVPYRKLFQQQYTDNKDITPESGRDICTNLWGTTFRMPTKEETEELVNPDNCQWTWETRSDGYSGYRVTSKKPGYTNYSIFIPAAGFYNKDDECHHYSNYWSDYWCSTCYSATNGYHIGFNNVSSNIGGGYNNPKSYGFPIRAVQDKVDYVQTTGLSRNMKTTEIDTLQLYFSHTSGKNVTVGFLLGESEDLTVGQSGVEELVVASPVNGFNTYVKSGLTKGKTYYFRAFYHVDGEDYVYGDIMRFDTFDLVDLDLPSHTLWANMDMGSLVAEDCGDYYAWGEMQPKSNYSKANYLYFQNNSYVNIGHDIGGTQYDPATMNMGKLWRLPTREQCEELCNECNWEQVTVNGVSCYKASSKTNPEKFIYLPKTQLRDGTGWYSNYNGQALFMTSNLRDEAVEHCLYLNNNNHVAGTSNGEYRYRGMAVRPVADIAGIVNSDIYAHVKTEGCEWTIGDATARLRGNLTLSGTVTGLTYGFIIGNIKDVDTQTPVDANIYSVDSRDDEGMFTYDYAYDGSPKFFRAYFKVGDTYYLGDLRSVTAADLLDVEFRQDGAAFNGTFSGLVGVKHGSPSVIYNDTYRRYEAIFDNTFNSTPSQFYNFSFGMNSDFMKRMEDGHTLEVLFAISVTPSNRNSATAFANYQHGGSGISVKNEEICSCIHIGGSYRNNRTEINPVANQYYHVVAVWNKEQGKCYIYVDGELKGEMDVTGSLTEPDSNSRYYVIGADANKDGGEEGWKGPVTFARIYDDPLTADQVQLLYNKLK